MRISELNICFSKSWLTLALTYHKWLTWVTVALKPLQPEVSAPNPLNLIVVLQDCVNFIGRCWLIQSSTWVSNSSLVRQHRLRWRMAGRGCLAGEWEGFPYPPQHPPHHPFHPDFSIRKLTPEKFIFRLFEGPVSWEENPASLEGDLLP